MSDLLTYTLRGPDSGFVQNHTATLTLTTLTCEVARSR